MTPEPYPTPWRWVDLGLPSRTLWLDRNVGADSPEDAGLYFQWGQKFGHRDGDGFTFTASTYSEQGLNLILSDLTSENDGASIYYGERYRMPNREQFEELIQNTALVDKETYVEMVSNANGNSIKIPKSGEIEETGLTSISTARLDCRTYRNTERRNNFIKSNTAENALVSSMERYKGIPIRPVYNR